jgi:hypothetical protein
MEVSDRCLPRHHRCRIGHTLRCTRVRPAEVRRATRQDRVHSRGAGWFCLVCPGAGGSGLSASQRSRRKTRSQVRSRPSRIAMSRTRAMASGTMTSTTANASPRAGCKYAANPSLPRTPTLAPRTRRAVGGRAGGGGCWRVTALRVVVGIGRHLGARRPLARRVRRARTPAQLTAIT